MFKIKVIDLLKSLNHNEFMEFGQFLKSAYLNPSLNLIKFYEIIKPYYPEFSENKINSEIIFRRLYDNKPYDVKLLSRLSADMNDLFEHFLILNELKQEPLIRRKFLLSQLFKRKLFKQFEICLERTNELFDKVRYKDEDYYLNKFFIETLKKDFFSINHPVSKLGKDYEKYSEQVDNLLYFFVIIMLKEYLHIHNRTNNVNYEVEYKFYDEIMSYVSKKPELFGGERLINLLKNFLKIYEDDYDERLVYKLKVMLNESKPYIKKDVYNFLTLDLFNYCMNQDELGRNQYRSVSINLMNEMLDENMLVKDDGYLSGKTYRNLGQIALRFDKLEWAKNFFENYKNRVQPDDRENSYRISLAAYYRKCGDLKPDEKDNFTRSLDHLNKVKTEDFRYMTILKNLQIRNYYSLGDLESILSILDSFKHYLQSNKQIPRDEYTRAINFIKSMNKFIKIIHGSKKYSLDGLKKEIVNYKTMNYKVWMLERIDELEKKNLKK